MTGIVVTVQGELLVPYALMQDRQAPDVERILQNAGLLPAWAHNRRWQVAADRSGYVLTFTVALDRLP